MADLAACPMKDSIRSYPYQEIIIHSKDRILFLQNEKNYQIHLFHILIKLG